MSTPLYPMPEDITDENLAMVLDSSYARYQSVEQSRWNESNIDSRFYSGDQDYMYQYFNFAPNYGLKKFFFNIIQQPCNMVTGYQRQHRKNFNTVPIENSSQETSDEWNEILTYADKKGWLNEKFSMGCEQSCTTGLCLMQPYLDYTEDPVNGDVRWKLWEYNSFLIDPYFRNPDMSDANFVWCQKYLSRKEAMIEFPDHKDMIRYLPGYANSQGRFYFLPENYNIARADLMVVSYYWYKTSKKKKKIINNTTGEVTEFLDSEENIAEYVRVFPELEVIEVDCPVWKVGTLINDKVLYHGENPLGDFQECPFVPIFWNYDPWIAQPNLRVRSLVRTLRDIQFLFNRRIILNHDISESSLNSGWMYLEDSIVDENVTKTGGQGNNIILKEEALRFKPEKIIPNAVPASDMQLADQLFQLIYPVSGINETLMGASKDGTTGIQEILRQGAGLITLQKYFDQWDMSFKLLGLLNMKIIQKNWNPFKVSRILGRQPSEQFFSKNFQKYDIIPIEGLNTATQQQYQFAQLLEFQKLTEIRIPPKLLLKTAPFSGKAELIEALEQQQEMEAEMAMQQSQLEMAKIEGQLENLRASTAEKLALARERTGRTKSNIGLFDEREAEVTENRARALKERMEALKALIETMDAHGELETKMGIRALQEMSNQDIMREEITKGNEENESKAENFKLGLQKFLL